MKKLLFFTMLFFCCISNSSAIIENECVGKNECVVLCNYRTNLEIGSRDLTIYYNYKDKNITIKWAMSDEKSYILTKTGAIDYIFSNSGNNIYWGAGGLPSLSKFSCPKNGYLDTSDLMPSNELCFDNDGVTCKEKYSNTGTAFAHHGGFVSQQKDYDFEDLINRYADQALNDILEKYAKGDFSDNVDIEAKIREYFMKNFSHGNNIPEFIINSQAYQNLQANIMKKFAEAKSKALEEAKKQQKKEQDKAKTNLQGQKKQAQIMLESGEIDKTTYDEMIKKINEDYDTIVKESDDNYKNTEDNWNDKEEETEKTLEMTFSNFNANVTWLADFNVSDYCESYLGNPEIKGKPAYYLQFVFDLIKYATIILLLVLTIVDFAKATASSNQDAMKKASTAMIKRIIIVVVVFLLPLLIKFLLTVLGAYSPGTCGIS